jgi:hypothetical protein
VGSPGKYDWQFLKQKLSPIKTLVMSEVKSILKKMLQNFRHDKFNKEYMQRRLPLFYLFIFPLTLCLLSACKFNPDMQGKGESYLQGEWQQDSVKEQKKLTTYSLYRLTFNCDSFYLRINTFSKVNFGNDTCMNSGRWIEYAKGQYAQNHDTLHLKGQFCNADYSIKNETTCFRSGVFEEYFKVNKKADSVVQFASTSNVIPINAHLIKKITCQIKPL